uniref:CDC37_C domain-containing protein n=1 Tax=Steinernema glaseri TaxID=37863 RepID=A0A1I7YLC9_9BILA
MADPPYMKMFTDEVAAFKDRVMKRAVQKHQQYFQQQEEKERTERIKQSPGGVDPQEVYDALPTEVANNMDRGVFAYHLQRCIDAGLWIPNSNKAQGEEMDS